MILYKYDKINNEATVFLKSMSSIIKSYKYHHKGLYIQYCTYSSVRSARC